MAVDSRDKRASALQTQQATVFLYPNPDNAITSQADRQFIAKTYAVALESISDLEFLLVQSATIGIPKASATVRG